MRRLRSRILLAPTLALLLGLGGDAAQAQSPAPAQARTEDVATIDGIVRAFYDVISGPAGRPRQWSRDSTLYAPGVRFVMMSERAGRPVARIVSHEEFVRAVDPGMVANGFFERELKRETRRFGNIAHVLSSYEFRATADGPVLGRGVNSIQLYWDGERWWITHAAWDDERPNNPLPPALRP